MNGGRRAGATGDGIDARARATPMHIERRQVGAADLHIAHGLPVSHGGTMATTMKKSAEALKKSAKAALKTGRDTAVRAGKVAKSAAVVAAKAGKKELERGWKATSPAQVRRRKIAKVAGALAGAAALVAAGMAVSRSRKPVKKALRARSKKAK